MNAPAPAPSVGVNSDGGFVVVWLSVDQDGDGNGVFGQRFASDGLAVGDEFFHRGCIEAHRTEPTPNRTAYFIPKGR